MNLFLAIKRLFTKKVEVRSPLDPETIEKERIIRAQQKELMGLRAELAKFIAIQREEKEKIIKDSREEDLKKEIYNKNIEIKEKKYGDSFSFGKFFYKLFSDKKFREEIEIYSKDMDKCFGKFGDIISVGRKIAVIDENRNILSIGKNLSEVFYKPEGLNNYLEKTGKILIPFDKDYNPKVDIEDVEVYDVKYDVEEKIYKETTFARQTAKDLLIKKDKELREIQTYADRLENINIGFQTELNDLKRALKLKKAEADNNNTELSKAIAGVSQMQISFGDSQRKITELTEIKAMYQAIIDKQDSTIKKLLNRIEKSGDRTLYEMAKDEVKDDIEWGKQVLPAKIIEKEAKIQEVPPVNKTY